MGVLPFNKYSIYLYKFLRYVCVDGFGEICLFTGCYMLSHSAFHEYVAHFEYIRVLVSLLCVKKPSTINVHLRLSS